MKTIVFGDIHGGLKGLIQLVEKINPKQEDKLIFLGDYVDGWSESAQVIDFLINLNQKFTCDFVLGNHDVWCKSFLEKDEKPEIWIKQGGKETVESYTGFSDEKKKIHLAFFNEMKNYIIDAENRLFIHAGFTSMHGPKKEKYNTNYNWDRTLWETAIALDKNLATDSLFYPKRLKLFKEIFIGHTPTTDYKIALPYNAANLWNVDTGAGFTGKLSALDIETKEVWQSENLNKLYPLEKGRNK